MKSENKSMLSGWIKGAFRGGKKEMQESIHQQLNFILSTAPIWDRFDSTFAINFSMLWQKEMVESEERNEKWYLC